MPQLEGLPAELAIAGTLSSAGWNVYSPHRDVGFDFIATKQTDHGLLVRPVQVKGCYLRTRKDCPSYGRHNFKLPQTHPEMALIMPFYSPGDVLLRPLFVAFLPWAQIRPMPNGNFRSQPARIQDRQILQRRDFAKFFDLPGIMLMDRRDWKDTKIGQ